MRRAVLTLGTVAVLALLGWLLRPIYMTRVDESLAQVVTSNDEILVVREVFTQCRSAPWIKWLLGLVPLGGGEFSAEVIRDRHGVVVTVPPPPDTPNLYLAPIGESLYAFCEGGSKDTERLWELKDASFAPTTLLRHQVFKGATRHYSDLFRGSSWHALEVSKIDATAPCLDAPQHFGGDRFTLVGESMPDGSCRVSITDDATGATVCSLTANPQWRQVGRAEYSACAHGRS